MANGLIHNAIKRPVSVLVGVLLVLLFGTLSLIDLPIQLTPDIAIPTIGIRSVWPGAAPTEIEGEILEPQEEALKSLPGLKRMSSRAKSDEAELTLEFAIGTRMEEALVRVTNRLLQVADYPNAARQPIVTTADATGPPLAVAILNSENNTPIGHFRSWVEERVVPPLERIPGVASVVLIGGQDQQLQIEFNVEALASHGLTVADLRRVVRSEIRDISAGDITLGKRRLVVRTPLAPQNPVDLEQAVVRTAPNGAAIQLGDVARVKVGLGKRQAQSYYKDRRSLALLFFREAGSNVLEVTKTLNASVKKLATGPVKREGLSMRMVFDQTGYITEALQRVRQNLFIGAILATAVLLFFLGSLTASAVVSVSIPVCIIGTALGMALLGRTVNIVSLAGMAFAVGMVVDNAIVVLESIHSKHAGAASAAEAALVGTHEVWGAILASTLTTAAVFLPVVGWRDEVGQLVGDVAVALSFAVLASLLVSVLVIPSFSAKLLRAARTRDSWLIRWGERRRTRVAQQVRGLVGRPRLCLATALGATVLALGITIALLPSMEYLPTGQRNLVVGVIVPPAGYSVEEMARIGESLQQRLKPHFDHDRAGVPAILRWYYVGRRDGAFLGLSAVDPQRTAELVGFLKQAQSEIPGVFGIATRASLFGRRLGGGRSAEIEVAGSELPQLVQTAAAIMKRLRRVMPQAQLRPIPTLDIGAPELHVKPRRRQLAAAGLSGADLGLVVDALIDGAIIDEVSQAGRQRLDVLLMAEGRGPRDPTALSAAPIATPNRGVLPLASVARLQERLGPTVVQRIERRRAITVQITPPKDLPFADAMRILRQQVTEEMHHDGSIPAGIDIALAGTASKLSQAQRRMGMVLLLALLISFLLLAALFEDFLAPLAVLITIPLAAAGGVLGLRLVDTLLAPQPLDMMTSLGFLILIGVVVNNAILVVDGALARLRGGDSIDQACGDAVKSRVRPIFMSALTSLAGLLPLVLFPGSGSELYRGVGSIVLGGLALSTVLTLYVVPAMFSLLWRLSRRC